MSPVNLPKYYATPATSTALEHADTFPRQVAELLNNADHCPTEGILRELGNRWVKNALQEGAMLASLLGESRRNPDAATAMQEVSERSVQRLAQYLSARIAAGELRADLPVKTAATSFIAALMVFLLMHQGLSKTRWKKEATNYVEELLSVWMHGARASQPQAF